MKKENKERKCWEEYFLELCEVISTRSTCLRRKVGCVIVKDNRILATGYNGVASGVKHCEEIGCQRQLRGIPSAKQQELCRGIHAEQNAIIQASKYGLSINNSMLYSTHQPCIICTKLIVQAGIEKVIFKEFYPDSLLASLYKDYHILKETNNNRTTLTIL